ncbi:toll/interleukin-1 receptor domain-containing protein [Rhizobium sp. 007]|uniref:toll/interleukin-1 receptor domain-containing protein n=1 Tax=Rhizobium sp. 007 TaxID=2785056 RepID=UPI00188ECF27|nr:toll/interleukin-1 receptor domain-containing protein [Rhizobium sp. 007]QPB20381.1 TIR domain-containing protein [Rhizobium sp. 007]
MAKKHDVFISHASPDKDSFVRPFAEALRRLGVNVWYDEFSIGLGDSIAEAIEKGIAQSAFGIVVISPRFIDRKWTQHEYRALLNLNVEEDRKIVPIWLGVTRADVAAFSPSLADKLAIDTQHVDANEAAIQILRLVRPDLYSQHPRADLEEMASGETLEKLQSEIEELREQMEDLQEQIEEYQCPYCGSGLSDRIQAPADPEEKYWDMRETFGCGFQRFGGTVESLCTKDPRFPKFVDYEIICSAPQTERDQWQCHARPKTEMARKASIQSSWGKTQDEARRRLELNYEYRAGKISNREWNDRLFGPGG